MQRILNRCHPFVERGSGSRPAGGSAGHAVSQWRQAALEAPETLYRIMLPTTFSTGFVESKPKVIRLGEERLRNCPPDFFRAFAQLVDAFRHLDITGRLDRIRCPTLVMVGEQDALKLPSYSRVVADCIPDSELVVIPEAGHAVILEKPSEVNAALLDFLAEHRVSVS
ncbi:MAG: alpha/beta fold hydrolase [Thermoanaerobaculia bacterium]